MDIWNPGPPEKKKKQDWLEILLDSNAGQPAEPNIYAHVSEQARKAALNQHIFDTLTAAREALLEGDTDTALEIIHEASVKYTRLGGKKPDPKWAPHYFHGSKS